MMFLLCWLESAAILVTHRAAIYTIEALGNWHPHLVSYVEQVVRAGQLDLRTVSRASAFKVHMLGAWQSCHMHGRYYVFTHFFS